MKASELSDHAVFLERWLLQHGNKETFTGKGGIRIAWNYIMKDDDFPTIVLLHGKSESYVKYVELLYDFRELPLNWFMMDHRGMGLSGRMTADKTIVHVDSFEDYVSDFKQFMRDVVLRKVDNRKIILVAHSMGGAVGMLYVLANPDVISEAVLSAPMFGIRYPTGGKAVSLAVTSIKRHFSGDAAYAPFQGPWTKGKFENNYLTHSNDRYRFWNAMVENHPELKSGGASVQWVIEATKAADAVVKRAGDIDIPVVIVQAGDDKVVSLSAQKKFASRCKKAELITVREAWHEVWNESDYYRDKAIGVLRHHLLKHCR